jgi:hypothetical protein
MTPGAPPRHSRGRLLMVLAAMLAAGVTAYLGMQHLLRPDTAVAPGAITRPGGSSADGASSPPNPYVGIWSSHAAMLTITEDLAGAVDWRDYGPDCHGPDDCQGHAMLDFAVTGAGITGTVASTTRPTKFRTGTTVIAQISADGTLTLTARQWPEPLLFCDPDARPGACGA